MPLVVEADVADVVRLKALLRDVYHHVSNTKAGRSEKGEVLLHRIRNEMESIDLALRRSGGEQ